MFGKPRARTPLALKLIPRVVHFDYETAMRQNRYWHGGDPVTTHFFNALQAMFPEGERFFMESARDVRDMLGKENIPAELNEQIKMFIRQEAMHGREHDAWSTALISLGYSGIEGFDLKLKYDNKWSKKHLKPIWRLSMTAAAEHFTASLAHLFVYKRPDFIEKAASPFRELLVYHAMEEVEHKAVCYDLYNEAKGGYFLRIFGMVFVTIDLLVRLRNRQEYMLKKDGLWNADNRKKMRNLLWGKDGIMRVLAPYLLQYFRRDFHPWETDERVDMLKKYGQEMQVIDAQQVSTA